LTQITHNLTNIHARILAATACYRRKPDSVQLLAVSKRHPVSAIEQAWADGQRHFGENFVKEALEKQSELELPIIWHFIGKIQSNKAKDIAQHFDWVHSVDRAKLIRRLAQFRGAGAPLNILLQLNLSDDDSRAGVPPKKLIELAEVVRMHKNLRLRGIMAMATNTADTAIQQADFAIAKESFDRLLAAGFEVDHLSMGMSQDLEAAISQGATWVRIGTDVFGPRPTP